MKQRRRRKRARIRGQTVTTKVQYQKARTILESLIQGLDPDTGAELPKDAVINRIEVNRSLVVAVAAMEQVEARILRRAQLPESVGKWWSVEEEAQLKAEFAESRPISEIASTHGRTVRAIEARLEKLGLLTPEQRTAPGLFTGQVSRRDNE